MHTRDQDHTGERGRAASRTHGDGAGRPRMDRAARRAQLLDVAREAFVAGGYHATSMDDIADRAGVSKPVLYQHFPGKLELYIGLLEDTIARLVTLLEAAMERSGPPDEHDNADRVRATLGAFFEFVDSPHNGHRLIFGSDLGSEPEVRRRLDAVNDRCATVIAAVVAADTGICPARARLVGLGLAGLAQAAAEGWVDDPDRLPREEAVDLLATITYRGLAAFPLRDDES